MPMSDVGRRRDWGLTLFDDDLLATKWPKIIMLLLGLNRGR